MRKKFIKVFSLIMGIGVSIHLAPGSICSAYNGGNAAWYGNYYANVPNSTLYSSFWGGDIMQYCKADNISCHSQIVTGQSYYNGHMTLKLAQHSENSANILLYEYLDNTAPANDFTAIRTFKFNSYK